MLGGLSFTAIFVAAASYSALKATFLALFLLNDAFFWSRAVVSGSYLFTLFSFKFGLNNGPGCTSHVIRL